LRAEEAFGDAICGCSNGSRDNVQANSAWGECGVVCMQLAAVAPACRWD
jgi:hypothetical protein